MTKENKIPNAERLKLSDLMTNLRSRTENAPKPNGGGNDDAWNHWEED